MRRNIEFDHYIYIRPDLYFSEPCDNITNYNPDKISLGLGLGPIKYTFSFSDLFAIIPKKYRYHFFMARMELIRNNTLYNYETSEQIYYDTIKNHIESKNIGKYIIKRK